MEMRYRKGLDETHAVFPKRLRIADEPGFDREAHGCTLPDHRLADIVIGIGLVDEAAPVFQYGDDPGLVAVDQVREAAARPFPIRHFRNRNPGGGIRNVIGGDGAGFSPEPDAVAGIAGGGRAEMLGAVGSVGKEPGFAFVVVRKASAGQNHSTPRKVTSASVRRAIRAFPFVRRTARPYRSISVP